MHIGKIFIWKASFCFWERLEKIGAFMSEFKYAYFLSTPSSIWKAFSYKISTSLWLTIFTSLTLSILKEDYLQNCWWSLLHLQRSWKIWNLFQGGSTRSPSHQAIIWFDLTGDHVRVEKFLSTPSSLNVVSIFSHQWNEQLAIFIRLRAWTAAQKTARIVI